MHRNALEMFEQFAVPHLLDSRRILEIGPDGVPSSAQRALKGSHQWETADLQAAAQSDATMKFASLGAADITYLMHSPEAIPVEDRRFDAVVALNVLEHVERPWAWLKEVVRVLGHGGLAVMVTPVSWPEHLGPKDCFRYLPDGMRSLFREVGLEELVVEMGTVTPPARRTYPGSEHRWPAGSPSARGRVLDAVKRTVGWPIPAAVDLVAVARRPYK